jgi:hypothetical protein
MRCSLSILLLLGATAPVSAATVGELLAEARSHYDALDYDKVAPLAQAVLAKKEATLEQRLDAYFLQGASLAVLGDIAGAQKPFRFLLRGRPDFDLPPTTPPKILAVFRQVQVEERAIVQQMAELERSRIVKTLVLEAKLPEKIAGGQPLHFDYRLQDPRGAVAELKVQYRKLGIGSFSSLALARDSTGHWLGDLPGDWTANRDGLKIEYYVSTADTHGQPLLQVGDFAHPVSLEISPGEVAAPAKPVYKSAWFWVATVGGAAALAGLSVFAYTQATALPHSDLGAHAVR